MARQRLWPRLWTLGWATAGIRHRAAPGLRTGPPAGSRLPTGRHPAPEDLAESNPRPNVQDHNPIQSSERCTSLRRHHRTRYRRHQRPSTGALEVFGALRRDDGSNIAHHRVPGRTGAPACPIGTRSAAPYTADKPPPARILPVYPVGILDRCRAPIFTPTSAESPASRQIFHSAPARCG
jgi:hypothetical protein